MKNSLRICRLAVLGALLAASLTVCGGGDGDGTPVSYTTILWEDDGNGYIQFYTNDPQYKGYSAWAYNDSKSQNPFIIIEAQVKKISGDPTSGIGIIFCHKDDNNFYILLIDTTANYGAFQIINGTLSTLISKTPSASLNTGYNTINTLKVINNVGQYYIYLNNTLVNNFTPDPALTGGAPGFFIEISTNEEFPNTPLDGRFKLLQP